MSLPHKIVYVLADTSQSMRRGTWQRVSTELSVMLHHMATELHCGQKMCVHITYFSETHISSTDVMYLMNHHSSCHMHHMGRYGALKSSPSLLGDTVFDNILCNGQTALYDAIMRMLRLVRCSHHSTPADIVILTDGNDNASADKHGSACRVAMAVHRSEQKQAHGVEPNVVLLGTGDADTSGICARTGIPHDSALYMGDDTPTIKYGMRAVSDGLSRGDLLQFTDLQRHKSHPNTGSVYMSRPPTISPLVIPKLSRSTTYM